MLTLLIETSTERGLVALGDPEKGVLKEKELPMGMQSSNNLWEAIQEMVPDTKKLDLILAGIGPGSYTGIRVGVAVAQGLAYALKKPLIGVCSLEGFVVDGPSLAVVDARISGAYIQEKGKNPQLGSLLELVNLIQEDIPLVVPSKEPLKRRLEPLCPSKKITWIERAPNAAALFAKGWASPKDAKFEILYLRKTQAELEREQ
jgi:tRNA threonylcarbamoyladenosine biosynthesis protein TsaB